MKKAFLFALVALCAFTAQAVSTSWTKYGTGLTSGSYELDATKTSNGVTVALVVDFTNTEATTQQLNGILTLLTDSYTGSMSVGLSNGVYNAWTHYTDNGTQSTSFGTKRGDTSFNVGKNIFGISIYEGTAADNRSGVFIDYYVNGTLLDGDTIGIKWTGSGQEIVGLDEFIIGSSATGADVYVMYDRATAADYAAIPEPTVFALLALGVAGLALKRKVA